MDDDTTPLEAGLGWVVSSTRATSSAATRSCEQKERASRASWSASCSPSRGIAAPRLPDPAGRQPVGVVTSGTAVASLGRSIGLALRAAALAAEGSTFAVDIRGRAAAAEVVQDAVLREEAPSFAEPEETAR